MEIGRKFNTLSLKEYFFYIDHHEKYTDFNTLGLYRSIVENEQLTLDEKITLRDYAHQTFRKSFDFLQLKDPMTFMAVTYLGETLSVVDERRIWDGIRKNQEKILRKKNIKHRNFGEYAKHNCGHPHCMYNGLMIRQGSAITERSMFFDHDHNRDARKEKAVRLHRAAKRWNPHGEDGD